MDIQSPLGDKPWSNCRFIRVRQQEFQEIFFEYLLPMAIGIYLGMVVDFHDSNLR